jgi:hypothetical protein
MYPPSYYKSSTMPVTKDWDASCQTISEWRSAPAGCQLEEYPNVEFTDFAIYRDKSAFSKSKRDKYEMVSLHHLGCKPQADTLYFDGTLEHGTTQMYVERVPPKILSSAGYQDQHASSVRGSIWIQSIQGKNKGMWYTVSSPNNSFRR